MQELTLELRPPDKQGERGSRENSAKNETKKRETAGHEQVELNMAGAKGLLWMGLCGT